MKLNSQLIRSLRLILALSSGSLFANIIHIPMSSWVFITTAVIVFDQDTVGGTINRSFMRFFATFAGATISLICILLIKDCTWLIWTIVLFSNFGFAYFYIGKKQSYIGLLASITLAMLLLGNKPPDLYTGIYRVMDILIGVSFALLSMLLFFPEYALKKLPKLIASLIQDNINLIKSIEKLNDIELIRQQIITIEDNFINNVSKFNKALEESGHELSGKKHPLLIESYRLSSVQVRRIYRLIFVVFYYEFENEMINDLHIKQALLLIVTLMENLSVETESNILETSFTKLSQITDSLPQQNVAKTIRHIHNELFILENLLAKSKQLTHT